MSNQLGIGLDHCRYKPSLCNCLQTWAICVLYSIPAALLLFSVGCFKQYMWLYLPLHWQDDQAVELLQKRHGGPSIVRHCIYHNKTPCPVPNLYNLAQLTLMDMSGGIISVQNPLAACQPATKADYIQRCLSLNPTTVLPLYMAIEYNRNTKINTPIVHQLECTVRQWQIKNRRVDCVIRERLKRA